MTLMRVVLCALLCFLTGISAAQKRIDSLLVELDKHIEKREQYLSEKLKKIQQLKELAQSATSSKEQFSILVRVYDQYKTLNYDSAFVYARKVQNLAYQIGDHEAISNSRVKLAFVLVSSGLFHEALDTLRKVNPIGLSEKGKVDYYYLMGRTCYDLSDFNRDEFFSTEYNTRGNAYMDSAMAVLPDHEPHEFLMKGLKFLHLRDIAAAQSAFETMIKEFSLTDEDFAIAASTLSFIYFYNNQPERSKEMLIRAAISDVRSCTKETLATLNLADMLYKEGDIEKAYKYVQIALEDANYYGARHRKIQVAAVFPIIEGRQLSMVESRRKMLFLYSSVITVLSLITIGFAIIIYKQFKTLREAKRVISEANETLTETNHQLSDANKIKEEYIWYYFNTTADYIGKLDTLKRSMELKVKTKKLDDLKFTVDSINIKREREDLYHNFDLVFLKLFPDFVKIFNSFFAPEDQIHTKEGQLLNTELRIFALIRMGISDNDKIAKILDYSVTTIYTYKTRIRSKSLIPNEQFDKEIMAIRAI
jgi:tetratricopeptide (TPR) repeat protein